MRYNVIELIQFALLKNKNGKFKMANPKWQPSRSLANSRRYLSFANRSLYGAGLNSRASSKPISIFRRARSRLSQSGSCLSSALPPQPVRLLCCVEKLARWTGAGGGSKRVVPLPDVETPPSSWTRCSASESREARWLPSDSGDLTGNTKRNFTLQLHFDPAPLTNF